MAEWKIEPPSAPGQETLIQDKDGETRALSLDDIRVLKKPNPVEGRTRVSEIFNGRDPDKHWLSDSDLERIQAQATSLVIHPEGYVEPFPSCPECGDQLVLFEPPGPGHLTCGKHHFNVVMRADGGNAVEALKGYPRNPKGSLTDWLRSDQLGS